MKITIICLILVVICLYIGYRFANLDKPMKMWLPDGEFECNGYNFIVYDNDNDEYYYTYKLDGHWEKLISESECGK